MTLKLEDIDPNEDIRMKGADLIGYLVEARIDEWEAFAWADEVSDEAKDAVTSYWYNRIKELRRLAKLSGLVPTSPGATAAGNDLPKYDPKADIEATWRRNKPTPPKADDVLDKRHITNDQFDCNWYSGKDCNCGIAEAKQQLADGLVALPVMQQEQLLDIMTPELRERGGEYAEKLQNEMHARNQLRRELKTALLAYFGIGGKA